MKHLTRYAFHYVAVLTAAVAVVALLASAADPKPAGASKQVVAVQANTAHASATMNVPF